MASPGPGAGGPPPFMPKQACPVTPQYMKQVLGETTNDVARAVIEKHTPTLPSGSVVHDNACGTGIVTQILLGKNSHEESGPALTVHATDINPMMVQATKKMIASQFPAWQESVHVVQQDSTALEAISDDFFDYSYSNFLAHVVPGEENAIKVIDQVYRTVKPGGFAMLNCWCDVPHDGAMLEAHAATRPPKSPPHMLESKQVWKQPEYLKGLMEKAGFKNVETEPVAVYINTSDLRNWLSIMWTFLGPAVGGWTKADEDNWNKAIDIMYERMKKDQTSTTDADGNVVYELKLVANVAVATK